MESASEADAPPPYDHRESHRRYQNEYRQDEGQPTMPISSLPFHVYSSHLFDHGRSPIPSSRNARRGYRRADLTSIPGVDGIARTSPRTVPLYCPRRKIGRLYLLRYLFGPRSNIILRVEVRMVRIQRMHAIFTMSSIVSVSHPDSIVCSSIRIRFLISRTVPP